MSMAPFGEMLRRFVPLSNHDVSDILEDQLMSGRRFGEIALSLGWCQPDHVWRAWCAQLAHNHQTVDLEEVGVDTQSLGALHASSARAFGVIPIRILDDQLVLAVSAESLARAREELPQHLNRKLLFVVADSEQIRRKLNCLYPAVA
ncbi:MAG TPA: hypothetical protein VIM11_25025 [Tepidisphaeraceae bacterium]